MAARDDVPLVLARRQVRDNRYFAVVEEDLPDRHGRPYTYHSIDCHWDAVVVVPVLPDGRLLIERIYRHPYHRWFDEFPAGGIEQGEDPLAAAARELREETGYAGAPPVLLHAFEVMPGLLRMRLSAVLIADCVRVGEPQLEPMEMLQVEAVSAEEAWRRADAEPPSSFLVMGLWAWQRHRGATG